MTNTWYKNINTNALTALLDEYQYLVKSRPHSSIVSRWRDDFRMSFIYNTNAIEGNPITENDTDIQA